MKKVRLLTFSTFAVILSLLLLVGCKKEDKISALSFKDIDPNSAIEIDAGDFDFDKYTLVVTYESGKTDELPLTEDMIDQSDLLKLYQAGEHEVTVSYKKHKCTLKVSVARSSFKDLSLPQNNVFVYDGEAHTVEVDGDLPANASVSYPSGNSFVNAGSYDVTAIVSCEGYVTETLSTTVKIERAVYDMSGVVFEDKEVVYDGSSHSLVIKGTLPEGVAAPTYTVNGKEASSATDADEYKVVAHFANNDPNYEPIPDMSATLKITPAEYTVKGVDIVFRDEDGKIISDGTKIYDGKSITFDLNDYSKLSKKISVSFTVSDTDGKEISYSNLKTNIIDVGVYTVKAEFELSDSKNYKPIPPIEQSFEVIKAEHPALNGVRMVSAQITYDGEEHSIKIEGELPDGITVRYEYYQGDKLLVDKDGKPVQSVSSTGVYTVKAIFKHENKNLGNIADAVATLNIKKAVINPHMISFDGEDTVIYSGNAYKPTFTTMGDAIGLENYILHCSEVKYYVLVSDSNGERFVEMGDGEAPVEVGTYRAAIDVSIADEYKDGYVWAGGADVQTVVKQFEILKKEIAIPTVEFKGDFNLIYAESGHEIDYECTTDTALTTVTAVYFKNIAGEYTEIEKGSLPKNRGFYRLTVTVAVNNGTRYMFANGKTSEEFSFDFEIHPMTVNVEDVISLSYIETVYNGTHQPPRLQGVPDKVEASVSYYSVTAYGSTLVTEVKNKGDYRCEVKLSPINANYELSSDEILRFNFKIDPIVINADEITFDTLDFYYDGNAHLPVISNLPAGVIIRGNLYDKFSDPVQEAVAVGTYIYKYWLRTENSNYVLTGQTDKTVQFEIKSRYTQIADIDELRAKYEQQPEFYIEVPHNEKYNGGYYWQDDDPVIAAAICDAIFGEYKEYAECSLSTISGVAPNNGTIEKDKTYDIKCRLAIKDEYINEYRFIYNETYAQAVNEIMIRVRFV